MIPDSHQPWSRRSFLKAAAMASGLTLAGEQICHAEVQRGPLIDVNVSLSRWPLRRLPCDEPGWLVAKLRSHGVTQAWAGTFDGLLHKDLAAANARLAEDCRRFGRGMLLPFGSIDPTKSDWVEELRRCVRVHHMRGVRLHPNYHGYTLDDSRFKQLLQRAAELNLIVQLALLMEDERMMHPRLRVNPVDTGPLAATVKQIPGLCLVLLNALRILRGPRLSSLLDAGDVWVELAMLEGVGGIENLLTETPADRVLFGSHAPLFYFEAAELKLRESLLTVRQTRAIRFENAMRVFDTTRPTVEIE